MRIALITDASLSQINGVVNTLRETCRCLRNAGHEVLLVTPDGTATFACPTYPEIRLAYKPYARVATALRDFEADCIHISTEGPMGLAARRFCLRHGIGFTTAYHTRFPEYLSARSMLPLALTYRWLRWFHGPSKAVMVPTPHVLEALKKRGFRHLVLWGRGVDTERFHPTEQDRSCIKGPLFLYVGRVAVEKNIAAFLNAKLPGSKWIVGDGPLREELQQGYPDAHFLGSKSHEELSAYYNCADVLVFPSHTDTFGLVMLEAMACGVPVAAYPVCGPIDVVADGYSGSLELDLARACMNALRLDRDKIRAHALTYSWERATQQFLQSLYRIEPIKANRWVRSSIA
ncbi:glycosyltransferase family 4 protein [Glaciimonas immobilis]|uniref:Glycosyltransferase involved in cell wall biosynthesis n=1 Tax=Glaciimonas immobilis TaxID=728004 RepID=A0A840RNV4_9BURK|nr:glycosyltransferase family 1 protein [Glaciimonas immobilis]KAF3998995.1 glycosyltransferase family 1 protein [Glaciimonas immobilis]MBB5198414.1 glycosyltransferase involved in cell wall biosynthesis [Glaciimonas immobilis]